jgi:menaquinol-cytochrome c reductase iron-sulfur subunit
MNSDFDRQHHEPSDSASASSPVAATDSRVADRRKFLFKLSIAINAAIGLLIATPVIRFLLGPLRPKGSYDSWITLGKLADYPEGSTLLAFFRNPTTNPWDGETGNVACYVRRQSNDSFTVFAVNCAHLGAYYADGSRAAGPPERGLFTYASRVDGDTLMIQAGSLPTLANQASLKSPGDCPGRSSANSNFQLVKDIAPCSKAPNTGTNEPTIG